MKKSTLKLIVFTIIGIIASIVLYSIDTQNPLMVPKVANGIEVSRYITPFIGLFYWLFCRQLDD